MNLYPVIINGFLVLVLSGLVTLLFSLFCIIVKDANWAANFFIWSFFSIPTGLGMALLILWWMKK